MCACIYLTEFHRHRPRETKARKDRMETGGYRPTRFATTVTYYIPGGSWNWKCSSIKLGGGENERKKGRKEKEREREEEVRSTIKGMGKKERER